MKFILRVLILLFVCNVLGKLEALPYINRMRKFVLTIGVQKSEESKRSQDDEIEQIKPSGKIQCPLHEAIKAGSRSTMIKLIQQGKFNEQVKFETGMTPLHLCIIYNFPYIAMQLLETVDPDSMDVYGTTPLHLAVAQKHPVELTRLLLANKAKPNIKDKQGETPLHKAMFSVNTMQLIKLLLDNAANPNVQNEQGETPLHTAASNPYRVEPIRLLLTHNADPNVQNELGNSPLHTAILKSCSSDNLPEQIALLAKRGNPCLRNKKNETPFHLAAKFNQKVVFLCMLDSPACESFETAWEASCLFTDKYKMQTVQNAIKKRLCEDIVLACISAASHPR